MDNRVLIQEAMKAREKSYAPYSNFLVGAALLTKSGKIYHGCNIENAAFSPTNCAERTAFFKAVSEGEREFEKIAIVGALKGEVPKKTCAPCGVCRQVMLEFCNPKTFSIVVQDEKKGVRELVLESLIPLGFAPDNIAK